MTAQAIGVYASPIIVLIAACAILLSKKDLGEKFLEGARDGMDTSFKLLPSLVMLICAVRMFCASGAVDILCRIAGGFTAFLGIPDEMLALILVRPFSGSAATALADSLFKTSGPDSFAGRSASVLMGASDTIVYTLALYFGAAGIKKTRYALPASFVILIFCAVISVKITGLFFAR